MKCPSCGQENRPTATFCSSCGALLMPDWEQDSPFHLDGAASGGPQQSLATSAASEPPVVQERPTIRLAPMNEEGAEPPAARPPAIKPPGQAPEAGQMSAPQGVGPLPVRTIVGNRFEIAEILEETSEQRRYRVRDWCRCPACGYDDNAKGDAYCLDCGAALEKPVWAEVVEIVRRAPPAHDLTLSERGRDFYVTYVAERKPADIAPAPAAETRALGLRYGRLTDTGLQRNHNEDYAACWTHTHSPGTTLGLFVVADGLGGQDSGEVASRLATDAVWRVLREQVWAPVLSGACLTDEQALAAIAASVREANRSVYESRKQGNSEMSTTLTMALVANGTAYIANVGDSRVYLHNASGLRAVTKDHSLVQRLIDSGQITPNQVYTHPQRNLIYQSIGDRPQVRTDTYVHALHPDDRLVLCSDGLWETVRNEGIEDVLLAEPDPQRACDRLVHNANLAGGEDNISVIVVQMIEI